MRGRAVALYIAIAYWLLLVLVVYAVQREVALPDVI
jgi:hypothetical protein